jgi:hypothetical protein
MYKSHIYHKKKSKHFSDLVETLINKVLSILDAFYKDSTAITTTATDIQIT